MFTGIIESLGVVKKIEKEGSNLHLTIASPISKELKIDQSIAHDGVCLTVVAKDEKTHRVTAIKETLDKSTIGEWKVGHLVNLERAMASGARLDGHMVQGHVDMKGVCIGVKDEDGSKVFTFQFPRDQHHIVVNKGSICINGVSLTVVDPVADTFSVAIIPFTIEHTNFKTIEKGTKINLEFDIIGKYIAQYMEVYAEGMK